MSISALLTPSRSAESWLPLIRITRAPVAAEPGERVLAERDRVHRRDGPVVDVARDEDGVHPLGARGVDEVVEEFRLRLSQVGPVERPPEVPVRGVQEPHGRDSSEPLRHSGPELGLLAAMDASRRWAMTTTAREAARAPGAAEIEDAGHVDALIIGAGVSGIGVAHHFLDKFPDRTFVILDAQDNRGGTWWTHRYPGVRSDSDLFTYGYRFKPWRGPAIAAGGEILAYLDEVIDEDDLGRHIRYQHRVTAASWSTQDRQWTVEVTRDDTGQQLRFTAGFLWMCPGYYNHAEPYRPRWEGMDRFQGAIVHPQDWPEDLDLAGRRVVVIGSGATAATLIPAIAPKAEHVTMLQRSPSYFYAPPADQRACHDAARAEDPGRVDARDSPPPVHGADGLARPDGGGVARRAACLPRSSPCARCCHRASTSSGTSPRATGPGSSASPSCPTAICSRRCARGRPRSSPTPSRPSPSAG